MSTQQKQDESAVQYQANATVSLWTHKSEPWRQGDIQKATASKRFPLTLDPSSDSDISKTDRGGGGGAPPVGVVVSANLIIGDEYCTTFVLGTVATDTDTDTDTASNKNQNATAATALHASMKEHCASVDLAPGKYNCALILKDLDGQVRQISDDYPDSKLEYSFPNAGEYSERFHQSTNGTVDQSKTCHDFHQVRRSYDDRTEEKANNPIPGQKLKERLEGFLTNAVEPSVPATASVVPFVSRYQGSGI